jgi:putative transposase
MEEELRKAAMRRYILSGERPKQIYSSLRRSRKWFFKWLKRYETKGLDWNKDTKTRNGPATQS